MAAVKFHAFAVIPTKYAHRRLARVSWTTFLDCTHETIVERCFPVGKKWLERGTRFPNYVWGRDGSSGKRWEICRKRVEICASGRTRLTSGIQGTVRPTPTETVYSFPVQSPGKKKIIRLQILIVKKSAKFFYARKHKIRQSEIIFEHSKMHAAGIVGSCSLGRLLDHDHAADCFDQNATRCNKNLRMSCK